jgi:hypothetical protein
MGIAALATPDGLSIALPIAHIEGWLLLGSSIVVALLFLRKELHWVTGGMLLAGYLAYIAFAFVRGQ